MATPPVAAAPPEAVPPEVTPPAETNPPVASLLADESSLETVQPARLDAAKETEAKATRRLSLEEV
jgi:hypothetical protein